MKRIKEYEMKKKLALVLAFLLVLSSFSLVACSNGDTKNGKGGNDGEIITELDPNNRYATTYSPNIPYELKFTGETFNFLIGSIGYHMYAEEENSDLINDTTYRRNNTVADRFGINLNIVKSGFVEDGQGQIDATMHIRSLIESNDTTYHAFSQTQNDGMPQLILEGYFVDWNTVPYINLQDEWWHQNISDDLSFGDKIYVMTGDYALYLQRINCLLFNKEIFDELGLEYPYQDVLDGTWTWDKFLELVKQGAADLNGDGLMTFEDDQWGLLGWAPELCSAMLVSSGYVALEHDADNMPVLNQNVDEAHEIFDRIINVFKDGQYAWSETQSYADQFALFGEGKVMFKDAFLFHMTSYSDTEFDFGVLPYPKWDEETPYMSRSADVSPLTYIPVTNTNLELTGAVLEEMAYQSAKELTPTFFDIVLTTKSTRDVESEEMLPIIKNSSRFFYSGYSPYIPAMVATKINTFSSSYAANLSVYQKNLEDMRELLLDQR